MGLFSSKTAEEKAAEKQQRHYERWLKTPQGQARLAYERGDVIFQATIDLATHRGEIVPMMGDSVSHHDIDVNAVLNGICSEGWELVNGTVVFVPSSQESRDKFMSSGQQIAVSGRTVGYYLFRRRN